MGNVKSCETRLRVQVLPGVETPVPTVKTPPPRVDAPPPRVEVPSLTNVPAQKTKNQLLQAKMGPTQPEPIRVVSPPPEL